MFEKQIFYKQVFFRNGLLKIYTVFRIFEFPPKTAPNFNSFLNAKGMKFS